MSDEDKSGWVTYEVTCPSYDAENLAALEGGEIVSRVEVSDPKYVEYWRSHWGEEEGDLHRRFRYTIRSPRIDHEAWAKHSYARPHPPVVPKGLAITITADMMEEMFED